LAEIESVDRICEQIRRDGEKEVNSILDKAKRTAAEIIAKAEGEAEKVGVRIVAEATEKAELAKKRSLSSVSLEVKRIHLRAREEVVTAVMDKLHAEIGACRSRRDYAAVLVGLVVEALRALEGNEFVVYADRRDLALLESAVFPGVREEMAKERRAVKRIEAKALAEPTAGGVSVGVPGGKVIYDNTFEARLYRLRDDIRAVIFESVFSAEDKVE
jgi:vacuolar-type H+-ATPase subunit E/Vma4